MEYVVRKSLNYRDGTWYKSHGLEARCISKTICKLNTLYFRGSVVEVLENHNVRTWYGTLILKVEGRLV